LCRVGLGLDELDGCQWVAVKRRSVVNGQVAVSLFFLETGLACLPLG
jgi:hypothetical protein